MLIPPPCTVAEFPFMVLSLMLKSLVAPLMSNPPPPPVYLITADDIIIDRTAKSRIEIDTRALIISDFIAVDIRSPAQITNYIDTVTLVVVNVLSTITVLSP
jgi:hypothetical protein